MSEYIVAKGKSIITAIGQRNGGDSISAGMLAGDEKQQKEAFNILVNSSKKLIIKKSDAEKKEVVTTDTLKEAAKEKVKAEVITLEDVEADYVDEDEITEEKDKGAQKKK